MPTPLLPIDLSAVTVGSTGKIDLSTCAPNSNPRYTNATAILQVYNESAAGLRLTGKNSGLAFDLPAGGWNNIEVPAGETEIDYVVLYVMQGALVNTLLATYYALNESVPRAASVGNSPIGGSLSQATSVIQDGTAYPKTLVESSPSNYPSLTPQSVNLLTDGTLTLVTPSNGAFTPAFKVVPGSAIGGGAFSHIEADNGQVLTDGVGNTTLKTVKAQAPVKLAAGSQETGYCSGLQNNVNNTGTTGGPANFKTTMTNIPSSITVNVASSSNAPAPTAGNITLYGFSLFWTPTAAGNQSFVEATYVTVGN